MLSFFQNARGVEIMQTVQWSGYELNNLDFESGQRKDSLLFSETFRLALRPNQPARQGKAGMMLTNHVHLVTERTVNGAIHPFTHMPYW
jgi:hypothetical protein